MAVESAKRRPAPLFRFDAWRGVAGRGTQTGARALAGTRTRATDRLPRRQRRRWRPSPSTTGARARARCTSASPRHSHTRSARVNAFTRSSACARARVSERAVAHVAARTHAHAHIQPPLPPSPPPPPPLPTLVHSHCRSLSSSSFLLLLPLTLSNEQATGAYKGRRLCALAKTGDARVSSSSRIPSLACSRARYFACSRLSSMPPADCILKITHVLTGLSILLHAKNEKQEEKIGSIANVDFHRRP